MDQYKHLVPHPYFRTLIYMVTGTLQLLFVFIYCIYNLTTKQSILIFMYLFIIYLFCLLLCFACSVVYMYSNVTIIVNLKKIEV